MKTHTQPSRPFLPEDLTARARPSDYLFRAVAALVSGAARPGGPEAALGRLYPSDAATALVLRAAVNPASLGDSAWAGSLAATAVSDFVGNLGARSAASALFASALRLSLDGAASLSVPGIISAATNITFVGEAQPIPARQLLVAGATLSPRKLGVLIAFTEEMAKRSQIEQIVRATLSESTGLALDTAMFGSLAADTTRPAGLLNGVAAIAATAGGTADAMRKDIGNLVNAIAAVAGAQIVIIAAPGEAAKLSMASPPLPFPILSSGALASGTIVAVATNALAVAIDPLPEIDISKSTVVHMDDAPLQIGTTGTPNAAAAPTTSAFQSALIVLRFIVRATWGLRAPGAVAHVTGVTW